MVEISIVGTFHFPDRFDVFSGKTQREIATFVAELAKWQPDAVAIELPVREQKRIDAYYRDFSVADTVVPHSCGKLVTYGHEGELTTLNEAVQVGFRLAKILGHSRVYGIDEDMELSDELAAIARVAVEKPFAEAMRYLENAYENSERTVQALYRIHNDPQYLALDHAMYLSMNAVNQGGYEGARLAAQWYERNLKIFSNLQNLCADKTRVFVLIGSSHVPILKELVRGCPGLEPAIAPGPWNARQS